MTRKTTRPLNRSPRRRRVGKARGGKGGWEPRSEIHARVARVVLLHEQGCTQDEIARDVGVSQAAVSKMLQRIDHRAVAALEQQLAALKMRRLRTLEYLSREGRRAWEQSKQGRVRKRQRKTTGGGGEPLVTHEVLIEEHPDPRMLDQARKAEEVIAAVCGFTGTAARAARRPGPADPPPDTPTAPADTTSEDLQGLSLETLRARALQIAEALGAGETSST